MSYTPFTVTDAADLSLAADFVVCRAALAEVVDTYSDGDSYELPAAVERAGYLLARTEEKAADLGRQIFHAQEASGKPAQRYPHPLAEGPIENCSCAGCAEAVTMGICWHGDQCTNTPADESCGHCWHEQHGHACRESDSARGANSDHPMLHEMIDEDEPRIRWSPEYENFVPQAWPLWLVVELGGPLIDAPMPIVGTAERSGSGDRVPCVIFNSAECVDGRVLALDYLGADGTVSVFPTITACWEAIREAEYATGDLPSMG